MHILHMAGAITLLLGSIFLVLGALGVVRMPDSYNRIQAGTKATTLGTMLTMAGLGMLHPGWLPKLAILIFFIIITNPISSHVLAKVMHDLKIPVRAGAKNTPREEE
ncbi:monovalent cation/H(+) antiporter subunit G [Myxococcota bacterium]|nr:monovalent cation/H(+) antiporter subunit G [Myxococcota bacterium]MBU1535835.1 monovalent cation/H(+) antiporter subunit G [Myxococcota bacterium]